MKVDKLREIGACRNSVGWAVSQPSRAAAWQNCERGDWLLWLLGELSGPVGSKSRKKLVLTACECARLALPFVEKGEKRPLQAIETAERYVRGKATIEEVLASAAAKKQSLKQCADIVRKHYPRPPRF